MKKINNIFKTTIACLFAAMCVMLNTNNIVMAAEDDGSAYAIIEVQDYTVEGGMIEAGREITVNFTIHNTASNTPASSIMMTLSNGAGNIYPAYGKGNQVYIGALAAGETKSVSVPLTIGANFSGSAIEISCSFDYISAGGRGSNTSTIVIPTSGGSTIGVKSIDVSSHAIVNGKSLLSLGYINQSSANITDAILIVDGNVSENSKRIKLDTVYAGKSYTQDYYVTFTEPGNQQISVSLTYTDIDGQTRVTDLGTYGVSVSKESEEISETSAFAPIFLWGGRALAGIAGICVLVAIASFIKKR